ncbi:hypothetical protein [Muricomes intestini]|uniref:hypothetical protein n=1 Tax=Muricomes intestini TaxID=1796634 RepID=UPI002FE0B245
MKCKEPCDPKQNLMAGMLVRCGMPAYAAGDNINLECVLLQGDYKGEKHDKGI